MSIPKGIGNQRSHAITFTCERVAKATERKPCVARYVITFAFQKCLLEIFIWRPELTESSSAVRVSIRLCFLLICLQTSSFLRLTRHFKRMAEDDEYSSSAVRVSFRLVFSYFVFKLLHFHVSPDISREWLKMTSTAVQRYVFHSALFSLILSSNFFMFTSHQTCQENG